MLKVCNVRSGKILDWPFSIQKSDRSFSGRVKCGFKTAVIFLPRLGRFGTPLPATRWDLFDEGESEEPLS